MTAVDVEAENLPAVPAPPPPARFVPAIVLSAIEAKAQVDAIREMQRSVLEAGSDYGMVPGTERPALFKSGAELLLKVHGFGHHFSVVEVERDADGRKYAVTYRCHVTATLPTGQVVEVATCDGYCGYDESKYFKSIAELEATERAYAEKDRRPVRTEKFAQEYRAPWNTVIKMAQKRALVGAALQATGASGLFTQDVEDQVADNGRDSGQPAAGRPDSAAPKDRVEAALGAINHLPDGVDRAPFFKFVRENGRNKMSLDAVGRLEKMLAACQKPVAAASPANPPQGGTAPGPENPPPSGPGAVSDDQDRRRKAIHARCRDHGITDEDVRHALVAYATGMRTTSTNEVTEEELPAVLKALDDFKARVVEVRRGPDGQLVADQVF